MLKTVCTRGGSSVGVIPADPHEETTPKHMVWIQTVYSRVYVAFFLLQIKALRLNAAQILKLLGNLLSFL